jgi:phospholipid transport system substrate-binding protein
MTRNLQLVALTICILVAPTSSPAVSANVTGASPAAGHAPGAIDFLRAHDARVQAVLERSGDSLSATARQEVRVKIDAAFDFEELSRLSLGDHWGQRSEAERSEFVTVFSGIISEKNFDSFVDYYRDGDIVYDREEIEPPRASVHATVPLEAETVGITYRLLRHAQSWRVYDLVIDDVSTADSNRRQYARYIEKHSFEKLMSRLKKQLAKLEDR